MNSVQAGEALDIETWRMDNPIAGNSAFNPQICQHPSTIPMNRRVASLRHCFTALALDMVNCFEIELAPTFSLNLPSAIFPDSSLPFAIDEALLRSLQGIWDSGNKMLISPKGLTEPLVKDWLSSIANKLASVTGYNPTRAWSVSFVRSPEEVNWSPDVILTSNPIDPLSWAYVKAVVVVTSHSKLHTEMRRAISYQAYHIFSAQPSRRFVPFLAICSKTIYFVVTDREGQVVSEIHYLQREEYHALNTLRIVTALVFATDETIGYDPTVTTLPNGNVRSIIAGDELYKVQLAVHVVRSVVGRSTRVWSASHAEHGLVIVKDGWIHEPRAKAEEEYLKVLQGIRGIPRLIWAGTVQIHNPGASSRQQFLDDNTAWIRHGFSDGHAYRIHRRLVLSPVGQKLSLFTSLGELVAVLRDVAVGKSMTIFM